MKKPHTGLVLFCCALLIFFGLVQGWLALLGILLLASFIVFPFLIPRIKLDKSPTHREELNQLKWGILIALGTSFILAILWFSGSAIREGIRTFFMRTLPFTFGLYFALEDASSLSSALFEIALIFVVLAIVLWISWKKSWLKYKPD